MSTLLHKYHSLKKLKIKILIIYFYIQLLSITFLIKSTFVVILVTVPSLHCTLMYCTQSVHTVHCTLVKPYCLHLLCSRIFIQNAQIYMLKFVFSFNHHLQVSSRLTSAQNYGHGIGFRPYIQRRLVVIGGCRKGLMAVLCCCVTDKGNS